MKIFTSRYARLVTIAIMLIVLVWGGVKMRKAVRQRNAMRDALVKAAEQNDSALVLSLMPYQPDTEMKDRNGDTVLLLAVRQNHMAVATALMNSGARVNVTDRAGRTPLMYAALRKQSDIVREMLEHGANPFVKDKDSQTAVTYAQRYANYETTRVLVDLPLPKPGVKAVRPPE